MERHSFVFREAQMAMEKFHMPYDDYLRGRSFFSRMFQMHLYNLHLEKEGYYATPKDKRMTYLTQP